MPVVLFGLAEENAEVSIDISLKPSLGLPRN